MHTKDPECVKYARECVRLAGLYEDPLLRDQLLDMARSWMAEAMHEHHAPASAMAVGRSAAS